MANGSVSTAFLVILNIVYTVLGLALTAASIWFFVEVQTIANLRNYNHYITNFGVYWPQAIPWMFLFAGIFVVAVSICGFVGAKKKSRKMVLVHIAGQSFTLLLLIVSAVVALTMADTSATDHFVTDTIWDAFNNMNGHMAVETAFGTIEKRYQCCGAGAPRDYLNRRNRFPQSCCDTYYGHGWQGDYLIDCSFTNTLANERLGCAEIASHYARIAIKVFSGAAIFIAFIGILNLICAVTLSKQMKNPKPRVAVAQYESESKKVLI